ncbi:MAG TPA: PAS domain-containing protein [Rhizomicrobium sp.]
MTVASPVQACAEFNALAETKGWPTRCHCGETFERSDLNALCELWRSKAANGVPPRSAFGMRVLAPYLRNITILEREGENGTKRYRFRLFGSTLALLFGEHTGRTLDQMVSADMLPSWLAFYDTVLACRQPLRVDTHYRTASEGYVRGEILAAPLADDSGEVRMVLAATYVGFQDGVLSPFG